MAEAPAFRPGLRIPSRCKGANQNNAPGTPKELAWPKPKNAAFQNQPVPNGLNAGFRAVECCRCW